jgi:hypothetical protein
MRLENNGVNSQSSNNHATNGATPLKSGLENHSNGTAPSVRNGTGKLEAGSTASSFTMLAPPTPRPDYFGHDREEVTRILIQALVDLGYHKAATLLEEESEYTLESPRVSDFRRAILRGEWGRAEQLLYGMDIHQDADFNVSVTSDYSPNKEEIAVAWNLFSYGLRCCQC